MARKIVSVRTTLKDSLSYERSSQPCRPPATSLFTTGKLKGYDGDIDDSVTVSEPVYGDSFQSGGSTPIAQTAPLKDRSSIKTPKSRKVVVQRRRQSAILAAEIGVLAPPCDVPSASPTDCVDSKPPIDLSDECLNPSQFLRRKKFTTVNQARIETSTGFDADKTAKPFENDEHSIHTDGSGAGPVVQNDPEQSKIRGSALATVHAADATIPTTNPNTNTNADSKRMSLIDHADDLLAKHSLGKSLDKLGNFLLDSKRKQKKGSTYNTLGKAPSAQSLDDDTAIAQAELDIDKYAAHKLNGLETRDLNCSIQATRMATPRSSVKPSSDLYTWETSLKGCQSDQNLQSSDTNSDVNSQHRPLRRNLSLGSDVGSVSDMGSIPSDHSQVRQQTYSSKPAIPNIRSHPSPATRSSPQLHLRQTFARQRSQSGYGTDTSVTRNTVVSTGPISNAPESSVESALRKGESLSSDNVKGIPNGILVNQTSNDKANANGILKNHTFQAANESEFNTLHKGVQSRIISVGSPSRPTSHYCTSEPVDPVPASRRPNSLVIQSHSSTQLFSQNSPQSGARASEMRKQPQSRFIVPQSVDNLQLSTRSPILTSTHSPTHSPTPKPTLSPLPTSTPPYNQASGNVYFPRGNTTQASRRMSAASSPAHAAPRHSPLTRNTSMQSNLNAQTVAAMIQPRRKKSVPRLSQMSLDLLTPYVDTLSANQPATRQTQTVARSMDYMPLTVPNQRPSSAMMMNGSGTSPMAVSPSSTDMYFNMPSQGAPFGSLPNLHHNSQFVYGQMARQRVSFDRNVRVVDAFGSKQYDRKSFKEKHRVFKKPKRQPCKMEILEELLRFKLLDMKVHEESQGNTDLHLGHLHGEQLQARKQMMADILAQRS
ncbi:hypothetical protein SARC_08027 [Sphaeroforma arctica JP610]|uniref:Uncharacterized protein n=1 Tax=Sphaeroforma arctica JP610 TaxID=667725 RepID=A0A0L0FSA8_9EUKA|nr:hypothetical protein SARC_08027 [Sphaeroforma arctica JP610]KNC79579.1 hypothetical protein SARC_08027 [Sphaeroforma arctica JP610]|eukprot:XP_014153481.1 hypothetical protein SARC_08027 [Sphaeroforma arctica JP610]